jgi:translation initiation factor eIF-2B subunit delta
VCAQVSPTEADEDVRKHILKAMDNFVNEKFIFAEQMVTRHACGKIDSGDVIVTYGHSSVVQNILLTAKKVRNRARLEVQLRSMRTAALGMC